MLGENDPPIDFRREEAAYEKVRERFEREHAGKVALVVGDDVIGVFATADEAYLEGCRRFGRVKMMIQEIRRPGQPLDFVGAIDPFHPSVRWVELRGRLPEHGQVHDGR